MASRRTFLLAGLAGVLCAATLYLLNARAATDSLSSDVSEAYQRAHDRLNEYLATPEGAMGPLGAEMRSQAYKDLVRTGPSAVPLMVASLDKEPSKEWPLRGVLQMVTRHYFSPQQLLACRTNRQSADLWLNWFKEGQQGVNRRVAEFWSKGDAESVWKEGIAALPPLADMLSKGDMRALPIVERLLTDRAPMLFDAILPDGAGLAGSSSEERSASFLAWWAVNKADWTVPFPEPKADNP